MHPPSDCRCLSHSSLVSRGAAAVASARLEFCLPPADQPQPPKALRRSKGDRCQLPNPCLRKKIHGSWPDAAKSMRLRSPQMSCNGTNANAFDIMACTLPIDLNCSMQWVWRRGGASSSPRASNREGHEGLSGALSAPSDGTVKLTAAFRIRDVGLKAGS